MNNGFKYVLIVLVVGIVGVAAARGIVSLQNVTNIDDVSQKQTSKVLIFVTSPNCHYCTSVEIAIQQGAALGWTVQRVRSYPGTYGTPNLVKVVGGRVTGKLVGGPQSFESIQQFLR